MTHSTRVGGVGGVPGTLLRLAVGLEDANDLIADLDQRSLRRSDASLASLVSLWCRSGVAQMSVVPHKSRT